MYLLKVWRCVYGGVYGGVYGVCLRGVFTGVCLRGVFSLGSGRFGFDRLGSRTQAGDVTQQEAGFKPPDAAVTFTGARPQGPSVCGTGAEPAG